MTQNQQEQKASPFSSFVSSAEIAMSIAFPPFDFPENTFDFVQGYAKRAFFVNFVSKVRVLDCCWDRLCELSMKGLEEIKIRYSRAQEGKWTNEQWRKHNADSRRLRVEMDAFTSLLYYEAKSVTDMLKGLGTTMPRPPELHFFLKARDRFLAHPQLSGVMPDVLRIGTTSFPGNGGPAIRFQISAGGALDPLKRHCYFQELGLTEWPSENDVSKKQKENERLVCSSKKNEDFSKTKYFN